MPNTSWYQVFALGSTEAALSHSSYLCTEIITQNNPQKLRPLAIFSDFCSSILLLAGENLPKSPRRPFSRGRVHCKRFAMMLCTGFALYVLLKHHKHMAYHHVKPPKSVFYPWLSTMSFIFNTYSNRTNFTVEYTP